MSTSFFSSRIHIMVLEVGKSIFMYWDITKPERIGDIIELDLLQDNLDAVMELIMNLRPQMVLLRAQRL